MKFDHNTRPVFLSAKIVSLVDKKVNRPGKIHTEIKDLCYTYNEVYNEVKRLEKRGFIVRKDHGYYMITSQGRDYLDLIRPVLRNV